MRRKVMLGLLLTAGGSAMYLAIESLWKGILLVVGSILLGLGVNEITLMWEKRYGEID